MRISVVTPSDLAADSVLGGMMLSKDAIADVLEVLRPGDFYRPAHQAVYDAILDLYAKGEPADAVTVAGELERAGELRRIGGAPYLHTLISTVPTAANAGYYAESSPRRPSCGAWSKPAPASFSSATPEPTVKTSQRSSTVHRLRSTRSPNAGPQKTMWPLKSCCSRRWTKSTPSRRVVVCPSVCQRVSTISTNSRTVCTQVR